MSAASDRNPHETPYPICDADRISSLEAQLEAAVAHIRDLSVADERFDAERDRRISEVAAERDRRYAEVAEERSKALEIKQIADAKALSLAAEIQTYKDQKADELRGSVETSQGNRMGRDQVMTWIFGSGVLGAVLAGVITYLVTHR